MSSLRAPMQPQPPARVSGAIPWRLGWLGAVGVALCLLVSGAPAQTISVSPVIVRVPPGQRGATVTVFNQADDRMSFQVRAFRWSQQAGEDVLERTDELVVSPPLGVIPGGGTQVVRLLLRRAPDGREASYRILLDQIPPPPAPDAPDAPGIVRMALRLSLPVFAEPPTPAVAALDCKVEQANGVAQLLVTNNGSHHEIVRDIALTTPERGTTLRIEGGPGLPYVLPGATRRWNVRADGPMPVAGTQVRMTARTRTGTLDEQVPVTTSSP